MNTIELVNGKRPKKFGEYSKLHMKKPNQVRDSKVRIFVNEYEVFKMKPNEYIVEIFTRFMDIVNGLEGLGRSVSEQKNMSKILRCLPSKWNSKTKAIEEPKNLNQLPLEELIGFLMTYEMKKIRQEKEMQEKEGKKNSIALKAQEENIIDETKINDIEEDITLITKRVQKLMMKDKFGGRTYNRRSNYKKECPSEKEKEKR